MSESKQVNWDGIKKKLYEDIAFYESYGGKKGFNPFFFLSKEVYPLKERLSDGETSVELMDAILNIKQDEKLAIAPKLKPLERSYSKISRENQGFKD